MSSNAPNGIDAVQDGSTRQTLRQQHYQRVLEATRAVIHNDPTMGMKSVFAAVRERLDPSDPPKTKEVRRALAEVKPKAPKPFTNAKATRSSLPANDVADHPSADYTGCRADPDALSAGGKEACQQLLLDAQSFVNTHRVLLERQAFDIYFVVDNMWENHVPQEWRDTLATASVSQLAGLSLGKVPESWPSTLHQFVRSAQSLQLDPTPRHIQAVAHCAAVPATARERVPVAAPEPSRSGRSWRQHWQGASPKKREEMERMASVVVSAARAARTQNVIDVGSGKGYLSSLLALEHGLHVLAVEGNRKFTAAAEKRVHRIARRKATQVRPPNGDVGAALLPGNVSFLVADSGHPANFMDKESEHETDDGTKLNAPIFITAMVKAVRDDNAKTTDQAQTPGEYHENGTINRNDREEEQDQRPKTPLTTAGGDSAAAAVYGHASDIESGSEGMASAALRNKEARSQAMRRRYTTGAAASAVAASAVIQNAATSSTSTEKDLATTKADEQQGLKRPRPTMRSDRQIDDNDATVDGIDNGVGTDVGDRAASAGEQSVESLLGRAGLRGGAVLVGLHTCGDLAADSCRLFLRTPQLAGLVLCGCCYGRLTEPANFPLSTCGKQAQLQLGYTLRDLATHRVYGIAAKPEIWHERVLYTASYRATLEAFIRSCPVYAGGKLPPKAIQHCSVRKNVVTKPTFGAWAVAALEEARVAAGNAAALDEDVGCRSAPTVGVGEKELQEFYNDVMGTPTAGPHRLMALEALAACVWPVVEALVVVDRLAFLQERMEANSAHAGTDQRVVATATLQPLFDPVASPRNWVLIATRAPTSF